MITLVLGGARSGKSEVAERMAAAAGGAVTYVATGTATDAEMAARIDEHRRRRPAGWTTVESGRDLAGLLSTAEGTVLVDALGTWLAQAEGMAVDADGLCAALAGRSGDTVVVSDEVGMGVHPSTEAGRRFRDALGALNRRVADMADEVVLVVAGRVLPLERA
ncbi:MAG: bifunctional adenosylcobinamide kinase/adenosylcobinamide-phosphate guanylyltransferase [Acidimicrobiia bacterium]